MQLYEQEDQMKQKLHQEAQNKVLTVKAIRADNNRENIVLTEKLQILEDLTASLTERPAAFVKFFHETAQLREEINQKTEKLENRVMEFKFSPWFPEHALSTLFQEEDSTDAYRGISSPYDSGQPLYGSIGKVHNQTQLNCAGQWIPKSGFPIRGEDYLQIKLMDPENRSLCGIASKGRGDGKLNEQSYVTKYKISISTDDGNTWISFQNDRIFDGNSDNNTKKVNYFLPVKCTHVRIYPWEWKKYVSFRAAIIAFRS
jgi:hypothetical protein